MERFAPMGIGPRAAHNCLCSMKYGSQELEEQLSSTYHNSEEVKTNNEKEIEHGRGTFLCILLFLAFAGFVAFWNLDVWVINDVESKMVAMSGDVNDFTVVSSNEYGIYETKSYYTYFEDTAHSQLVEPHKSTTLTASGTLTSNAKLIWTVEGYEEQFETTNQDIVIMLNKTGSYQLSVESFDATTGASNGVYTTLLICKYVKRELRALSEDDRERFLDAAATLWQVSTDEGREIYGEKYTSAASFVEEHALASNDIRCDNYHEGSGFITHHLAITLSFEAALRAVDPSVTLPYWDFSIEGETITTLGKTPAYFLEITPYLTDTWFGSVDEDNHIENSRWAHSAMPKVTANSTVQPNSFGYIRSYWNNNNDEEVIRHLFDVCGTEATNKLVPDCAAHYDVLNTADLASFQLLSPSDGHGPMHVHLGGIAGDCIEGIAAFKEKWADVLNANMTDEEIVGYGYSTKSWSWGNTAPRDLMFERNIMGEYFHIYRSLWRSHMCARDNTPQMLVCPDSCDDDMELTDCKCTVPGLEDGTVDWEDAYYCVLSGPNRDLFDAVMPEEFIIDLVQTIGKTSIVEGEMLEAASPADIIFWVIHPTIDRLLVAKRLTTVDTMGDKEFTKWNSVDGANETWLSYSYYTQDTNENKYYPDAYTCYGHSATDSVLPDKLPLTDGFSDFADTDNDGIITNWEYFIATNPNNVDGLDYVYDNFDWDHCERTGNGNQPSPPSAPRDVSVSEVINR